MIAAFLQGGTAVSMGLLTNIRTFLFIRVSQDAYRQVSEYHLSHYSLHGTALHEKFRACPY